jgi:hypothetical protein
LFGPFLPPSPTPSIFSPLPSLPGRACSALFSNFVTFSNIHSTVVGMVYDGEKWCFQANKYEVISIIQMRNEGPRVRCLQ